MGERRGNPGAAFGTVVLTVVLTALLGGCTWLLRYWLGAWLVGLLAGVCFVDGMWWARRVGTGHWGLRREPVVEAPGPGVAADGEGPSRRWAAFHIMVRTLALTVVLGFGALIVAFVMSIDSCGFIGTARPCGSQWGYLTLLIPAAVCLVWGLVKAWRVATGRSTPGGERPAASAPAEPGRTWRVSEPGAVLVDSPSGMGVVARVGAGTAVVEAERRGDYIKVTAPDGRTGWLERRSVF
jgi:hypothetical protein